MSTTITKIRRKFKASSDNDFLKFVATTLYNHPSEHPHLSQCMGLYKKQSHTFSSVRPFLCTTLPQFISLIPMQSISLITMRPKALLCSPSHLRNELLIRCKHFPKTTTATQPSSTSMIMLHHPCSKRFLISSQVRPAKKLDPPTSQGFSSTQTDG